MNKILATDEEAKCMLRVMADMIKEAKSHKRKRELQLRYDGAAFILQHMGFITNEERMRILFGREVSE